MKRISVILALLVFIQISSSVQAKNPVCKDNNAPVESRIKDLVSKMSLDEKILQLNQYTAGMNTNANNIGEQTKSIPAGIGSLIYFSIGPELRNAIQKKAMEESRFGIPILFGYDVIHGFSTIYPISLAQACFWNPALVTEAAAVAGKEANLAGLDLTFSPLIDVAHNGRWGRAAEGYGE